MGRKVKVRNKNSSKISKISLKDSSETDEMGSGDAEQMLSSSLSSPSSGSSRNTRTRSMKGEKLQPSPNRGSILNRSSASEATKIPPSRVSLRSPAFSRSARGKDMGMTAGAESTVQTPTNKAIVQSSTPRTYSRIKSTKPTTSGKKAATNSTANVVSGPPQSPKLVEDRLKSPDRSKYLMKQLESTLSPKLIEPTKSVNLPVSRYGRIQKQKEDNDYIPLDVAKFITKSPPRPRPIKIEVGNISSELPPLSDTTDVEAKPSELDFSIQLEILESIVADVVTPIADPNEEILGIDQIKIVDLDVSFGESSVGGAEQAAISDDKEPVKLLERSSDADSAKGSSIDLDTSSGYRVGQLFWGALGAKTLHWPCLVCPDPVDGLLSKVKPQTKKRIIHITFFADNGRRSWVQEGLTIPFEGLQSYKALVEKEYRYLRSKLASNVQRHPAKWMEAVREAEDVLGFPIESREQRFKQLLELQRSEQKAGHRKRAKSLSTGYHSSNFEDSFGSRGKRARSPTPESPAYEALPSVAKSSESLSKRFKSEPDDSDLFRNTISRYFQSMTDGSDVLETASGTSSECEDISELAGFDREVYNDLLNLSRMYVFGDQTETEADQKLQKYVQKICALRVQPVAGGRNGSSARISNRLRSQALRNSFLKFEMELGIKQPKVESIAASLPVTPKVKKERKSLEELFIFSLEKNYLLKGVPKGFVCTICCKPNDVVKCTKCQNHFHPACNAAPSQLEPTDGADTPPDSKAFMCSGCTQKIPARCFVCHDQENALKDERKHRCTVNGCGKYYHIPCLRLFPQHKLTSTPNSSTLFCPYHSCHTCVSDDPRTNATTTKGQLIRCLKCPSSYHPDGKCVPAGSQLITTAILICPKHSLEQCSLNVNWCFLCCKGGSLICCETCPTAFHLDCLKFIPPEGKYICEECESGRMPLYNEIVWAKYSNFRFWPALTVPPPEIPDFALRRQHEPSDICIIFFGSHDYGWINRRRIYLYQEGDSDSVSERKKGGILDKYNEALREAKVVSQMLQAKKAGEHAELGDSSFRPPMYVKIKSNKYVPPLRPQAFGKGDEDTMCECKPTDDEPCGLYSNCINRALLIECNPKVCPAGPNCQNQCFEKKQYPSLIAKRIPQKGWGLVTLEDIRQGQFVIEYVGEVINNAELARRLQQKQDQKDENYYFLTVDSELTIDAGPKGNLARFINHSCEPNCETMLWRVGGAQAVGLFAIKDVKAGEELTFNYNFESKGNKKKICHCGATKCSGFIGKKYRPPVEDELSAVGPKGRKGAKNVTKSIKRRRHSLHPSALFGKKRKIDSSPQLSIDVVKKEEISSQRRNSSGDVTMQPVVATESPIVKQECLEETVELKTEPPQEEAPATASSS
ncbi:nuclear receptor binding SET domain protein isoform X2 [Toxorhynchites rutilus septentrionalis]|uniref:nuclear receptor binding SET domain protein isoform X2 n=1 Tax=Toxorhynchites rutilus septentrionalis TaxID=329112 RepID=UPI00247936CB|nr:nuclear receptor binding SET domain protein isoform X2 [Toxorhynchites rutilus septentrionalis]